MNEPQLRWHDPHWRRTADDWIRSACSKRGIGISGPIEQPHAHPWSTVLRVPTAEGALFFKATAPETIFEAALTRALAGWYPDCTPQMVEVDPDRGWMLMRDGGEPLRARIRPAQDIRPWEPVITRYAQVQVGLAGRVPELLALGVPDWRLARLPGLLAGLLADPRILCLDQPKGLSSDDLRTLEGLLPRAERICSDLAAFGIPETLNQCDLTDGNVLSRGGRITFFDWGDAGIAHPFVSLRTLFVSIEISLGLEDYSFTPAMAGLLDRYLEVWAAAIPREALQAAYPLSKCAASIVKALAWTQTVAPLEGAARDEYSWIVPEVLREFLFHIGRLPG